MFSKAVIALFILFFSAAALLAREAGYHARTAYGFSGGRAFPREGIVSYSASDANVTLTWSEVSVSGYNGVAWFYKVSSAQTIPVNKAIVVPGPLEIASGGTVTVQGRLHVI